MTGASVGNSSGYQSDLHEPAVVFDTQNALIWLTDKTIVVVFSSSVVHQFHSQQPAATKTDAHNPLQQDDERLAMSNNPTTATSTATAAEITKARAAANDTLPLPHFQQLLKVDDVARAFNITRTTIYKMIADETFPRPIKLGKRSSRWTVNDVQRIYDARCTGAAPAEVREIVAKIHAERELKRIAA